MDLWLGQGVKAAAKPAKVLPSDLWPKGKYPAPQVCFIMCRGGARRIHRLSPLSANLAEDGFES